MNKTYCPVPFRETMLMPGNAVIVCCRHPDNHYIKNSFEETFTNKQLTAIRQSMLSGTPVSGCEQCYSEEAQGVKSMRQKKIDRYGIVDNIELQYVSIQFDNICNLKCRMCASSQSHLLYEEEKILLENTVSWQKFIDADRYHEIDTTNLEEIWVHGGEPFLSKRADNFFKTLIEKKQVERLSIGLNTNGTVKPPRYFLEALISCHKLSLNVSIDAYGKLNDYFRSKSNFDTVIKNLDYFYTHLKEQRSTKETQIGVSITVNIYNVNKLSELIEFLKSRYNGIQINVDFLHHPDFLAISALPKEYKNLIRHTVELFPEVLKMLDKDDIDLFDEFVSFHNTLDQLRGENFDNLNPELSDYMKTHQQKKRVTPTHLLKYYQTVTIQQIKDSR
jgi:MoaA/NifB/PqqE/SkfB family radical SAM enzyme